MFILFTCLLAMYYMAKRCYMVEHNGLHKKPWAIKTLCLSFSFLEIRSTYYENQGKQFICIFYDDVNSLFILPWIADVIQNS